MPLFTRPTTRTHNNTAYDLLVDTTNSVLDTAHTVASYLEPNPYPHETFNPGCPTCHSFYHRNPAYDMPHQASSQASPGSVSGSSSGSRKPGSAISHHNHPYEAGSSCSACEAEKRRSKAADWILAALVVICPPAVAYIKTGKRDLWLNVLLTLFGWAPGMLHAWYLIILHPGVHHRHEQVWKESDPECYRPQQEQAYTDHRGSSHGVAVHDVPVPAAAPPVASPSGNMPAGGRAVGHWRDSKDTPPSYAAS